MVALLGGATMATVTKAYTRNSPPFRSGGYRSKTKARARTRSSGRTGAGLRLLQGPGLLASLPMATLLPPLCLLRPLATGSGICLDNPG